MIPGMGCSTLEIGPDQQNTVSPDIQIKPGGGVCPWECRSINL